MIWKNHAPFVAEFESWRLPDILDLSKSVSVSPLALLINIEPSFKYCGWLRGGEHFYLNPGSFSAGQLFQSRG
jgi:hypothetical protein